MAARGTSVRRGIPASGGGPVTWDASQNKCGITARCQPGNQTNDIYATVNDTKKLNNCNAQLRVGDCPGTAQTCTTAWEKSSAKDSCHLNDIAWDDGENKCSIKADCLTGARTPRGHLIRKLNQVYVTEDDAEKLSNCGGDLVVGSC